MIIIRHKNQNSLSNQTLDAHKKANSYFFILLLVRCTRKPIKGLLQNSSVKFRTSSKLKPSTQMNPASPKKSCIV